MCAEKSTNSSLPSTSQMQHMDNIKPYIKTLEHELDWKHLDQLSGTVSQISSFCFETKKFCVTTLFVALTLMVKFTSNKPDSPIFVAGFVIPVCFWLLDAIGYFYQVKLRGMMEEIRTRLALGSEKRLITVSNKQIINPSRASASKSRRVRDAFFNHSMWLYPLIILINVIVLALYCSGVIK
jgi:hypothetical protein